MQTGASIFTLRASRQRSGPLLLPLLLISGASRGQGKPAKEACDAFAAVSIPMEDRPTRAEADRLKAQGCNSFAIYYEGKGSERFVMARKCALAGDELYRDSTPEQVKARRRLSLPDDADQTLAVVVLSMLYANGEGVPRDAAIAKHYLCEDVAWNDPNNSIIDVAPGRRFEACNPDGTSSYGRVVNYVCLVRRKNQADEEQEQTYKRAERAMPAGALPAFRALTQAWTAFAEAHGAELPGGTSGAAQAAMAEALAEQLQWVGYVAQVSDERLPEGVNIGSDFASVDAKLNAQYQVVLKQAATDCPTGGPACLGPDDLRKAERAWLRYREAWVAFGQIRFPGVPAAAWRAWLTRSREGELAD